MKLVTSLFLAILFFSSNSYASDSLNAFDKEILSEFNSQYYALPDQCSHDFVDQIAFFIYDELRNIKWVNCEIVLNNSQKIIWSSHWAMYAWKNLIVQTRSDICRDTRCKCDFSCGWGRAVIETHIEYVYIYTGLDACSFNPTI